MHVSHIARIFTPRETRGRACLAHTLENSFRVPQRSFIQVGPCSWAAVMILILDSFDQKSRRTGFGNEKRTEKCMDQSYVYRLTN